MKALICGKYEMDINLTAEEVELHSEQVFERPMLHYLFDPGASKQLGRQSRCYEELFTGVKAKHVVELFGGFGVTGLLFQGIVKPERHVIMELDAKSCEHLEHVFQHASGVSVFNRDSIAWVLDNWQRKPADAPDMVSMDFNTYTINDYFGYKGPSKYRRLTGAVVKHVLGTVKPKYATITDTAINKLHLNGKHYEKQLQMPCGNFASYMQSVSKFYFDKHGYIIVKGCYHHGAVYTLLQRANVWKEPKLIKFEGFDGFELEQ